MGTVWDNQFVLRCWFSCKIVNFVIWELMNILQNTQGTFLFSYWRRNQSNTFFTGGESIATVKSSHLAVKSLLKNKTSLLNTFMSTMSNIIQMWYSFASLVYVAWLARQNHHLLFLSELKKKVKISLYVWNLTLAEALICNSHFRWPM